MSEHILFNGRPMRDVANDIITLSQDGVFTDQASADDLFEYMQGIAKVLGLELQFGFESIKETP